MKTYPLGLWMIIAAILVVVLIFSGPETDLQRNVLHSFFGGTP